MNEESSRVQGSDDTLLYKQICELEYKFDAAMTTLAFSALALSMQFSPRMGTALPYVLIGSWALLLFSGFLGGWRFMWKPVALKWNLHRNRNSDAIEMLRSSRFRAAIETGRAVNQRYEPVSEKSWERVLKSRTKFVTRCESEMETFNRRFVKTMKWQVRTLVAGLFVNGIFTAVNFLKSTGR